MDNHLTETIASDTGEILTTIYPKEIATAIAQVMGADLYVQKRGKNAFHGYKYATVGDLLDKLQPLMAEAGLVIFQNELTTDMIDGGNVMAIRYQFTLAHTSGAVWPEKPTHTGMTACRNSKGGFDDKAANKCHTAARKYFLLGLFQVPTGEDFREATHDGDADGGGDAQPPARPQQERPAPSGTKTAAQDEIANRKVATAAAPKGDPRDNEQAPHTVTPGRREEFFRRETYEISPKVMGSWSKWETAYRGAMRDCLNIDEFEKLQQDNARHLAKFNDGSAPPVNDALLAFVAERSRALTPKPANGSRNQAVAELEDTDIPF